MSIDQENDSCPCCGRPYDIPNAPQKHKKAISDDFDAFWQAYPKKTGKGYCREIWKREKLTIDMVLPGLRKAIASGDWQKDQGKFIPNPSTWLNQGRWEDDGIDYAALKVEKPVFLKTERKVDHDHYTAWKVQEGYPPCILTTQFREDPTYIQQAYLKTL
jgi:hypothetical protein